jgi:phosphotriesterase-related protein
MTDASTVQTVLGPVQPDALGVTSMHEHIFLDSTGAWPDTVTVGEARGELRDKPVTIEILGQLRVDPFASLDNMRLTDERVQAEEIQFFAAAGGKTLVDPTGRGNGRKVSSLKSVSERTGVNIIAATGWYLEPSHPPEVKKLPVPQLRDIMVEEVTVGIEGSAIRAGIIGEIGISREFTAQEERVLRASAQAQHSTGVPLMVHLPSCGQYGGRVLDIVAEEGGDLRSTILCHMSWEVDDLEYQERLLGRGCWLEYDMLGMDFFYPNDQDQAPCDRENIRAIASLVRAGYGDRLLLASDVFMKIMLRHYGGNGYDYVLRHFVPRLRRAGVAAEEVTALLVDNPRHVFAGRPHAK